MNVLMITGDTNIFSEGTEAYQRFILQKNAVDRLEVVFWGKGSVFPEIPGGDFDVVTVQDPFWRGLFALYIAWRKGSKLNVQVHTLLHTQKVLRRTCAHFVLKRAHSIRVVSERIQKEVIKYSNSKISILPVFVNLDRFRNIKRKAHTDARILWIGRFEKEKNPLEALSVLKKVRDAGINAELTMLGDGSMREDLKKAAKNLPVTFHGWDDPLPHLSMTNVVLSTSPYESFGVSIIEALASGVPVVSYDVGVAKEAGAHITSPEKIVADVVRVLTEKPTATLRIKLLSKEEWAKRWQESL